MTTMVDSTEAAAVLGVTRSTLYAYVSRGRLTRTTAPDGRTSLFARDEVEHLAARSRRAVPGPRPTIDVQVSSAVTTLDESSLRYRDVDVATLRSHGFEDVAEFLWSDGSRPVPTGTRWHAVTTRDLQALAAVDHLSVSPIGRLGVAALVLAAAHPDDVAPDAARRLLTACPQVLGSSRRTGGFAARLAGAWRRRPSPELVSAIDVALIMMADHELATSTLAVRIAASVRTSPYVAFAAGLASMEGRLHGSAPAAAHRLLQQSADDGVAAAVSHVRAERRAVPGFGHMVYRHGDPRFAALVEHVRPLDPARAAVVDEVVAEVGRVESALPNVDLALGALTWVAGLDADAPIFAVARLAGWGAHYAEELTERPVRFRGVAAPR